jgi:anti-sigma factor RsiW
MMNGDRELIHQLIDGDLPPDRKESVVQRVLADPALQEEYLDMTAALRVVEEQGPVAAPAGFTARVMRALPRHRPATATRLREFLFGVRMLRWNMATAAAFALVIVAGLAALIMLRSDTDMRQAGTAAEGPAIVVRLELRAPAAHRVSVAGTFNRWNAEANQMARNEAGVWTAALPLEPGVYAYMFIIDGREWVADPNSPTVRDDGFGNRNSVMRVGI